MKPIRAFFCAKTGACRARLKRHAPSDRRVARQRDAMHDAPEPVVVVDRVMLGAAVVPECQRARLPAEAAGELRLYLVAKQEVEQRGALLGRETLELGGMTGVDIERLAPGFGMCAHDRMLAGQRLGLDSRRPQPVLAAARNL